MSTKPKLIVFDLDWTLWPFHVESEVDPPFTKTDDKIIDRRGRHIKHFPDVPKILESLTGEGYTLAVASRTTEIRGAEQLLELFDWNKYFTYKEIYPGCKKAHFRNFVKDSGLTYKEMLFFDDDSMNIRDTVSIGVTSILVDYDGISSLLVEQGLKKYELGKLK